jgi:hypothetical protein
MTTILLNEVPNFEYDDFGGDDEEGEGFGDDAFDTESATIMTNHL